MNSYGGTSNAQIIQQTYIGPYEEWDFSPSGSNDGRWCIKNNVWNDYLSGNDLGQIDAQSYCGPWEKWIITLVQAIDHVSITYDVDAAI